MVEVLAGLNVDLSRLWNGDELAEILKKAAEGAGSEPGDAELCPTCGRPCPHSCETDFFRFT